MAPFRDVFDTYARCTTTWPSERPGSVIVSKKSLSDGPTLRDGKTPTKIGGIRGKLHILGLLMNSCLHRYDPILLDGNPNGTSP